MFGFGKPKVIAEHEAEGDIERVYHEIRQVLRVTGVNLNFRTWAGYGNFLPVVWDAIRPHAETRPFENAADQVRTQAASAAETLGRLNAAADVQLGESQVRQIRAALDLYHYINPKLLIVTAAVATALEGQELGTGSLESVDQIERGVPPRMFPMEMESDEPADEKLQGLFQDIQETLALPSINSDYRTLALWPDYLAAAWKKLKPVTQRAEYAPAADRLRNTARSLVLALPGKIPLTRKKIEDSGADIKAVKSATEQFERLLPGLILNIALCQQDWLPKEELARSPFPAAAREVQRRTA